MGRSAGSFCLFSSSKRPSLGPAAASPPLEGAGGRRRAQEGAGGRRRRWRTQNPEDKGRQSPTDLVHHRAENNGMEEKKLFFLSMIHINFVMREEAI